MAIRIICDKVKDEFKRGMFVDCPDLFKRQRPLPEIKGLHIDKCSWVTKKIKSEVRVQELKQKITGEFNFSWRKEV